jgi:hypothetical protein
MTRIFLASLIGGFSAFLVGLSTLLLLLWGLGDCDAGCAGGVGQAAIAIAVLYAVMAVVITCLLFCLAINRVKHKSLNSNNLILSAAIWMSPLSVVPLGYLFVEGGSADPYLLLAIVSPVAAASIGAAVCWLFLGDVRLNQNTSDGSAPNVA